MSYQLIVRSLAEQDLFEAQQWYETHRKGLGSEFRSAIDAVLQRLKESPQIYPIVYRDIRRVVVRRFPYLIYFKLGNETVTVLACLHGKRHRRLIRARVP